MLPEPFQHSNSGWHQPPQARPDERQRLFRFRCVKCGEEFEHEDSMYDHEKLVHTASDPKGNRAYYCLGAPNVRSLQGPHRPIIKN